MSENTQNTDSNSSKPSEPDYEGFVRHVEEWDANNVCYSAADLVELAKTYKAPIPSVEPNDDE